MMAPEAGPHARTVIAGGLDLEEPHSIRRRFATVMEGWLVTFITREGCPWMTFWRGIQDAWASLSVVHLCQMTTLVLFCTLVPLLDMERPPKSLVQ